MRLRLIRKEDLTQDQCRHFDERLLRSVQLEGECGPIKAWWAYELYLYGFVSSEDGAPIAVAEASGRPITTPGWWVDPDYRGKGYGNELVDLLAQFLRSDGVTSIGDILIQTVSGKYDAQSKSLVLRLMRHF